MTAFDSKTATAESPSLIAMSAFHLDGKVMSFPNSAPFFEAAHRVIALWNDDPARRRAKLHRHRLADFSETEFYFLVLAALELARDFPESAEGHHLAGGGFPFRPVLGFNLGPLAGQSIPHLHLQYGWETVEPSRHISNGLKRWLFYEELRNAKLILHEDDELLVVSPWTPQGRYHLQIHLKQKYWLTQLEGRDVAALSVLALEIIRRYLAVGIRNVNLAFTSSPLAHHWTPVVLDLIPRVNLAAFYESCLGVNVVDSTPEETMGFFRNGKRWRDIVHDAYGFDTSFL